MLHTPGMYSDFWSMWFSPKSASGLKSGISGGRLGFFSNQIS
jgi:hypothetical protein